MAPTTAPSEPPKNKREAVANNSPKEKANGDKGSKVNGTRVSIHFGIFFAIIFIIIFSCKGAECGKCEVV